MPAAAKSASGSLTLNCSSTAQGSPLRIVSPDGKDNLQVNVRAVSWAAQTVGIYAVLLDANGESQALAPPIEFTLSPYSFPFSDNTLLPSGNRFGMMGMTIAVVTTLVTHVPWKTGDATNSYVGPDLVGIAEILGAIAIGAVIGIGMKVFSSLREGGYIPFGPFLVGAGFTAMVFGPNAILNAVLNLLGL